MSLNRFLLPAALLLTIPAMAQQERVKLQTDWLASGEHAAYYGGWVKGIFAEEGLDITVERGYGSGDTVAKVGARAADFGVADISTVLAARARASIPVKSIASLYTYSPHSLFVLESAGITDFSQLEGKKIGTTPGNSHQLYFPRVARQSGLDPDTVGWVNMDGAALATQLLTGNIDAAPFYSIHWYYQNKAAQQIGEQIKMLPFVEQGFSIYAASLITTDQTLQQRPEVVRSFLRGAKRAFGWARDNPEEACELHVQKVPEVAMDDCLNSLNATLAFVFNDYQAEHGFGQFTDERLDATWQAVAETQELDPQWDPREAINTEFLPR